MRFFSYDSKFSQILMRIAWCCYLNLLWFVCSIPVFTFGASTTALYRVTLKLVKNEEGPLTSMFFRAFRDNFRQATQLWLILLGAGLVLGADGYILYHLFRASTGAAAVMWTLMFALVIVAGVAYVIVFCYVFPLTASVVNTNLAMLKNSFFIGTHYLFCTILVLGIHFLMFFAVIRIFTPLVIFGEGLCAYLSSFLLGRVIAACAYDPAAEQAAAEETDEDGEET